MPTTLKCTYLNKMAPHYTREAEWLSILRADLLTWRQSPVKPHLFHLFFSQGADRSIVDLSKTIKISWSQILFKALEFEYHPDTLSPFFSFPHLGEIIQCTVACLLIVTSSSNWCIDKFAISRLIAV